MTERELSRVAATRRGVHDRLAELDVSRPSSFFPRRTLRLRIEAFLRLAEKLIPVVSMSWRTGIFMSTKMSIHSNHRLSTCPHRTIFPMPSLPGMLAT